MDVSTPLIFVALFLLAFCSLFFVYKYGIKEKSYEEALAEQRQTTNALLGVKQKPKDKKNKKAAKKLKEKPISPGNETDDSENIDSGNGENLQSNKQHVEFKEEPEELPVREVVPIKQKRAKKIRPILIKKDKSPEKVVLDVVETPVANHFEKNPPKDEFELLRSNSRDDIFKQETVKEKVIKEKKQNSDASPPVKSNKKATKQPVATNSHATEAAPAVVEKEVEEKVVESVTVLPQTNGIVGNPGKEKKKKKSEFNTRQQMSAERDGLIKLVRKAEFSKSEVQLLIDLLLNKQLEAPEVIDDWSEGKSDPVQKLKKQLAEKEKAFAEEQEALLGVQAKLKEVRTEQQAERSQLQQKIRGLEEALQNKQLEHQAINNRLQVNNQKMQQVQAELNAEILKTHKLVEDNATLQIQIQQYEVRISQIQETDNIIAALRNDVERLSLELQQSLTEKDHQEKQYSIQMRYMERDFEQRVKELEEANRDYGMTLDITLREDNERKIEIANLNTTVQKLEEEKRRLENLTDQLKDDIEMLNNEKADNIKLIAQLKSELQQLKEEQASQVNGSSAESKAQEVEILNLTNELSSVRNELSSIKNKFQQTEARYKTELESSNKKYGSIQLELEEQKKKNNELRTKNWKVMEALNVAESRSKTSNVNKQTELNLDKIQNEIRAKERDSQKEFIQRLFPEIEDLQAVSSEDWQAEFGKLIKNYVVNLKKQQASPPSSPEKSQKVAKLEGELQHYKNIIEDTAGLLNNLQSDVAKEERNWRCQLQAKDAEIENLRETCVIPLQKRISDLEKQLSAEIKLKECRLMKSRQPKQTDATAMIEKLFDEVNHLREQLRVESTKNGDVNVCVKHCLSSSSSLASSVIEEISKKPKNKKKKKKGTGNQS